MAKAGTKKAPKQPKVETYADILQRVAGHIHSDEVMRDINPSTYEYTVGEEVIIGNLHNCKVEEVLYGGRVIHASYDDKGEAYGKPYDNQRRLPWVGWWMSVEPKSLLSDTNFSKVPSYMKATYTNTSLSSLLNRTYSRGLIDSPDYQRGYVWTLEDKQRLMNSVFNGFDIGRFILVEYEHPEWRIEVLDGKQRINALREFYEGRFTHEGKTYFELSRRDKHDFEELNVLFSTMKASHMKKSDLLWLFLSANQGGVPQTQEHIAHVEKLYQAQLELEAKG